MRPIERRIAAVEAALEPHRRRERFAWLQWADLADLDRLYHLAGDNYATEAARLEAVEIELRSVRRMLACERP